MATQADVNNIITQLRNCTTQANTLLQTIAANYDWILQARTALRQCAMNLTNIEIMWRRLNCTEVTGANLVLAPLPSYVFISDTLVVNTPSISGHVVAFTGPCDCETQLPEIPDDIDKLLAGFSSEHIKQPLFAQAQGGGGLQVPTACAGAMRAVTNRFPNGVGTANTPNSINGLITANTNYLTQVIPAVQAWLANCLNVRGFPDCYAVVINGVNGVIPNVPGFGNVICLQNALNTCQANLQGTFATINNNLVACRLLLAAQIVSCDTQRTAWIQKLDCCLCKLDPNCADDPAALAANCP